MNHLNLNFEGKNLTAICNMPEEDIKDHQAGVAVSVKEAIKDICNNIHDYEFDCDKCAQPHKSIHRGKVLKRLMQEAESYNEQLIIFGSIEFIMELIHQRLELNNNSLEALLMRALGKFKKNQA